MLQSKPDLTHLCAALSSYLSDHVPEVQDAVPIQNQTLADVTRANFPVLSHYFSYLS